MTQKTQMQEQNSKEAVASFLSQKEGTIGFSCFLKLINKQSIFYSLTNKYKSQI